MVRSAGIEPARRVAAGFEAAASAYSATSAWQGRRDSNPQGPRFKAAYAFRSRVAPTDLSLVTRYLARHAIAGLGPTLSRGPWPVGQLLIRRAFLAHLILLYGGSGVDSNSRDLSVCRFSRPVPSSTRPRFLFWYARMVSNHRPVACKTTALPLSYGRVSCARRVPPRRDTSGLRRCDGLTAAAPYPELFWRRRQDSNPHPRDRQSRA